VVFARGLECDPGIGDSRDRVDEVGRAIDGVELDTWGVAGDLLAKGIDGAGEDGFEELAIKGNASVQRRRRSRGHDSGRKVDNAVRHLCHAVSLPMAGKPDKVSGAQRER